MSAIQQVMLASTALRLYATWNPSDKNSNVTLSGGNLIASTSTTNHCIFRATLGKSSGKWYWEVTGSNNIGISNVSQSLTTGQYPGGTVDSWGYNQGGAFYTNNTGSGSPATYTPASDIIGVALDMDSGTVTFYKNNVSQGIAFTGLTGTLFPMADVYSGIAGPCTANFGATALTYTPPGGYNAGLYT